MSSGTMPEPQDLGRDIRNSQLFCVKAYAEPHFKKFDRIVEGTGLAQPAQLGAKLSLHCISTRMPEKRCWHNNQQ